MGLPHVLISIVLFTTYMWALYQVPIIFVGIRKLTEETQRRTCGNHASDVEDLPTVSIIVPAKNEEKVIGRLLKALLRLDYPRGKMEIIIIEDGSTDRTADICMEYAKRYPDIVKFLHRSISNGKPSALNHALKCAEGDIIAIFDADSVPEPDALKRAVTYFADPRVAAVQGRLLCINSEENMLTRVSSFEETVWLDAYLRGKDALGLFVYLRGSCQFIRRDILADLNGFDEKVLSEDMELSLRLVKRGYRIKYAPDVRSWQETPSDFTQFFRQRVRWFRGTIQAALKHGGLTIKLTKEYLDTKLTLIGPLMSIICLPCYVLAFYMLLANITSTITAELIIYLPAVGTSLMLATSNLLIAHMSKPEKMNCFLWLLLIFSYWIIQMSIALYATLFTLLRRHYSWIKTEKTGIIKTRGLKSII